MDDKKFRCKAEVEAAYVAPEKQDALRPKTFKEKVQNYWYHYKWHTIIIGFIVVVFGFTFIQFITKTQPDYKIMTAFDKYMPYSVTQTMGEYLENFGEDVNGDGEVVVEIYDISTSPDKQIQTSNSAKLMAELQNGEIMLFIVDEYYFDKLNDIEVFEKLADFNAKDGFAYNLLGTTFADAINTIEPEYVVNDFYIAKRVVKGTSFEKIEKSVEFEKQAKELLDKFIASLENP